MIDPLLRELVALLPRSAEWTRKERDLWLQTMEGSVDLVMLKRQKQRVEKRIVLPVFWNFVRGE